MLIVITCPIVSNGLVKVAHYIPIHILKSVENYLVMINSMMDKKFISQIGTKCAILDEKLYFQRFTLVKMNSWSISISIYSVNTSDDEDMMGLYDMCMKQ